MQKLNKLFEEVLSEAQDTSFVAYHGSPSRISKFEDSFLSGDDTTQHHGPGIYFTTSSKNARMFGEHIHKVRLNGKFIDTDTPPDAVDIEEIITLMKMSGEEEGEWEMEAQNYDEDPNRGIQIAAQSTFDYVENEVDVFFRVLNSWYQHSPLSYVRNMTRLGYDGMIVPAPRDWVGHKHIIVYNPAIIEISND
jgi:hypothetical protein